MGRGQCPGAGQLSVRQCGESQSPAEGGLGKMPKRAAKGPARPQRRQESKNERDASAGAGELAA